jgi:hypothetical protein
VYEKSLETRHFQVCPYPEEAEPAPSWAAGAGRDERNEKNGSDGSEVGSIIAAGQGAKKEILAYG